MFSLSLVFCLILRGLAGTGSSIRPKPLISLLDTVSNTPGPNMDPIRPKLIPEGTYIGDNIEITNRYLKLSGEQSNKINSSATHIVSQSGSNSNTTEEKFTFPICENCIFSLSNSTLSLESLHFSLIDNSEESRQQKNRARPARLAIVSSSMLSISQSIVEVSLGTSPILISPSSFDESSTPSSVVVNKCSISSESGQFRGLVETKAFPDCQGSRSISIVDCSFNSQEVLGKDGIGLSLTRTSRKNAEDVGMISSSLIGCSFVNMSSSGSSSQPQLSHLSQKMLGCVVSLTSGHLSGSTIRDVNNGGSILCSNSSFFTFLPSPNTDTDPSITLPNGTSTQFDDDGTVYSFDQDSGDKFSVASFSNCHFVGGHYPTDARPLTFWEYKGAISILSCSFANHVHIGTNPDECGGTVLIEKRLGGANAKPVTVEQSNFTNLKGSIPMHGSGTSGVFISCEVSVTLANCHFEECVPASDPDNLAVGALEILLGSSCDPVTITNLVFESCHAARCGGMKLSTLTAILFSDCVFDECCGIGDGWFAAGGLTMSAYVPPTEVTRLTFKNCRTISGLGGLYLFSGCDVLVTDLHFFRCTSVRHHTDGAARAAGGFYAEGSYGGSELSLQDCSFVECSSPTSFGGAFATERLESCVMIDCLVKDCRSGTTGAITLNQTEDTPSSISLTRVAFVNNSIGQIGGSSASMNSAEDTPGFVDVHLHYIKYDIRPTIEIVDCYTTCATDSIGMLMTKSRDTPEQSIVPVIDAAFHNIGPLLREQVVVKQGRESGGMVLEMKGKIPIAPQKYEVTIRKEGDTTVVNGEIEFVNGKGTLTSPSPSLTLELSTSYTITSIVGIVSSSDSSLSNAITFPEAAWAFNLASNPSFYSFTTPKQPPTLIGASADLVSEDQPLAFVILVFDRLVSGSYCLVIEEEGKDVTVAIRIEGSSLTGRSDKFVVVGEDRLLTHDRSYTIKSMSRSTDSESPLVWMNETITFHIPKSSFVPPQEPEEPDPEDPNKKSLSKEMKAMLSWLIPLVACLLIALLLAIVIIVLLRRRKNKAETSLKEMEEQTDDRVDAKMEVEDVPPDNTDAVIHTEAISHSNFGPNSSILPTEVGQQQSSKDDALGELVEVMKCSGDFAISTARMDTTLYSVIHTQKKEIGSRAVGIQLVNGLKQVVARRGKSGVLTQLSPHWILLDSAGNVHLKLDMNSTEAEQASLLAQKQQNAQAIGAKGEKSGMDGLRWRAPEVAAGNGQVDGQNASVFSLGLILWEIETGLVPYGEVDAIVAQKQSGTGIAPKLSDLHDDEFVSILTRCLSVNPKERPTLTEVGEFLSSHTNESAVAESRNEMKTQVG
ncbi:hypothetical protein BLNAU_22079 [Blattamonas nauphoetae]|uniref:Protein kinase domain-containing protein n=1 Tax=Blattamonas nauphoetae TaxID=2049346 RepID=A0ABQ9WU07_9EUKA|nr:hypothetical protein BLNAU_22079 [Blattamonas nauphoetae]